MKVRYRMVKGFYEKLDETLHELDSECFPDSQDCCPDFSTGTLVTAYSESKTTLGYGHMAEGGFIDRIGVAPDYQRQGIASRLLRSLISSARRQGLSRVQTYISRHNMASIGLFLALEFTPIGRFTKKEWWQFEKSIT